jgi:predicted enzyme related to lactoylglutathione lyase
MAKRAYPTRRLVCAGLLVAALGVCFTTAVVAASAELPPLLQPAGTEHHVGKVIWLDLVTPDLSAAKKFYGGLFGWTFHDIRLGAAEYSVAYLDGRAVGGLFHKAVAASEHRQPAWLTFIAVPDVDAAKQTAVAQGAKILAEPHTYPARGRQAVFSDPQGAVFAVLASASGDPPDYLAQPGEWIWSSLIAKDPGADAAFYQALFGYEVFESANTDGSEHLILATDDFARASANELPDSAPHHRPHWLNFVRVLDTDAMTYRVGQLGGRVLVEPRVDRHGGKIAVVADPSGAPFGLLEWSDTQTKEVTP